MRRGIRRYRRRSNDNFSHELVAKLWGIDIQIGQEQTFAFRRDAYLDHYKDSILLALTLDAFNSSDHVAELIDCVRIRSTEEISTILTAIQRSSARWSRTPFDDGQALQALHFATRLWLFSRPDLNEHGRRLDEANHSLHNANLSIQQPSTSLLSSDFSAKSLTRKGGFYLVWTSDLSEHLTFASKDQLRVFRHAYMLSQYQRLGPESKLYPPDFLQETYRTINLLFPVEDYRTSRRVKRIARREQVDIEAAVAEKGIQEIEKFQVATYKYYGARLAEVQRRYDLARPRRLTQWWYDRRQRPEWAALMVALIVFILTVLFGIAQTITGVLQVVVSRH